MSREHVNLLRSEIKSETGVDKTTYEVFRKKIIRTYMDAVENNNRHDYDSRLIREFNNRCDQLGFTGDVKITPENPGFTYTGQFDSVPTLPAGNKVLNPNFTGRNSQTNDSPGIYDKLIINFNGHPIGPSAGASQTTVQMSGYHFHSPMHENTNGYASLMLANLMSKESYNLLRPGQLLGYGDFMQDRVLKMFGQGDILASPGARPTYNSDLDRLMVSNEPFETPMTCVSNDKTTPALQDNSLTTGRWIKYDISYPFNEQGATPELPGEGINKIAFGCYIKVDSSDPLREFNFGGVYLRQSTGIINGLLSSGHHDYIDILQVKGSNYTEDEELVGTTGYVFNSGYSGCYNWGNGRTPRFEGAAGSSTQNKLLESFPSLGVSARILDSKLQGAASDWTLFSGETDYLGTGFCLNLFYCENHSYLNDDGVTAGAIYYSQPFVYFKS